MCLDPCRPVFRLSICPPGRFRCTLIECLPCFYPRRTGKPVPITGLCFHSKADFFNPTVCDHNRISASLFQNHLWYTDSLYTCDWLFKLIWSSICSSPAFRVIWICQIGVYLNFVTGIVTVCNKINLPQDFCFSLSCSCLINCCY